VVELGGQVSYRQALNEMRRADILLLITSPGRPLGIPAKLYEYLGAGRPILALAEPDGDVAWVLRTSRVPHRIVPALNTARIKEALRELWLEAQNQAAASRCHGNLARFTREQMARDLAAVLNECCPVEQAMKCPHAAALVSCGADQ
jgi:hypothetical protein